MLRIIIIILSLTLISLPSFSDFCEDNALQMRTGIKKWEDRSGNYPIFMSYTPNNQSTNKHSGVYRYTIGYNFEFKECIREIDLDNRSMNIVCGTDNVVDQASIERFELRPHGDSCIMDIGLYSKSGSSLASTYQWVFHFE